MRKKKMLRLMRKKKMLRFHLQKSTTMIRKFQNQQPLLVLMIAKDWKML